MEEAGGQGVAKSIEVYVNTSGLSVGQSRIFQTELSVILGDKEVGVLLGVRIC